VNTEAEIQNPLVTKLAHFAPLSEKDKEILDVLCANRKRFGADATVVREDEVPRRGFVLTRGMACRYRTLPDGRRQILTFLLPGDFFDLHVFCCSSRLTRSERLCQPGLPRSSVIR
jgi:CRP-like cAMP-binding protein